MADRPKRASFARLAVVLASLAFPLIVTGAAQAAIAGALPATSTLRPDLRSAVIDPLQGPTAVDVCFDKTLNSIGAVNAFKLDGYRAGNTIASTGAFIDQTKTTCAIVNFPATVDMTQYTTLEVNAGTVFANSGLNSNQADSVGLAGSTTHAGTTGVTTAPNLVGVLAPTGTNITTNSLTFVFDKAGTTIHPTSFFYVDAGGHTCLGNALLAGDGTTTVTVSFTNPCSGGGGSTVAGAVRAGTFVTAITSVSDPASNNPNESVVLPNAPNGGATQAPDLVSATIGSDQDTVVYTFDKNVIVNGGGAGAFQVDLAWANNTTSVGAVGNGGPTVTARFGGNLAVQSEFGVIAWANGGAVSNADNPTGPGNVPGSANVGDNAGAFGRAFTTGPDVFGVAASKSTGLVTVALDDRIAADNPANITLLDTTGTPIATPNPTVSFNSSAGPGPESITLQYPASALTNLGGIQFNQGALTEPAGTAGGKTWVPADAQNIQQIVTPVSTAAILRGYRAYKARHHRSHHKHARKHVKRH